MFGGVPDPDREPFVIALPLPNVTGDLHMGHALNGSYQDTLIRLRRMQGRDSLWICGTDHASIAVHAVIEKQLRAEGLTRWDLGRERFLERVWRWRARDRRHDHPASSSGSGARSTTATSGSRWTRATSPRCSRCSSSSTARATSTATTA